MLIVVQNIVWYVPGICNELLLLERKPFLWQFVWRINLGCGTKSGQSTTESNGNSWKGSKQEKTMVFTPAYSFQSMYQTMAIVALIKLRFFVLSEDNACIPKNPMYSIFGYLLG